MYGSQSWLSNYTQSTPTEGFLRGLDFVGMHRIVRDELFIQIPSRKCGKTLRIYTSMLSWMMCGANGWDIALRSPFNRHVMFLWSIKYACRRIQIRPVATPYPSKRSQAIVRSGSVSTREYDLAALKTDQPHYYKHTGISRSRSMRLSMQWKWDVR
jgi:hypothetical protein